MIALGAQRFCSQNPPHQRDSIRASVVNTADCPPCPSELLNVVNIMQNSIFRNTRMIGYRLCQAKRLLFYAIIFITIFITTRFRIDEAVYWVYIGQQWLVLGVIGSVQSSTGWYLVRVVGRTAVSFLYTILCQLLPSKAGNGQVQSVLFLYIEKVEIWSGVTNPS